MQALQTSAQFQAVMQGSIVGRSPHFVLHALHWLPATADDAGAGLVASGARPLFGRGRFCGVLVPKRWARRAVTRSTIKRQMRAVSSAHAQQVPEHTALVVRLCSEFDRKRFISATSDPLRIAVRTELEQLFARAAWQDLRPLAEVPRRPAAARAAPALVTAGTTPSGTMRAAP